MGETGAARLHSAEAAERFAAIGWLPLEAAALEMAGRRSDAVALYRRVGATAEVRRLELCIPKPLMKEPSSSALSRREWEVAAAVARGSSNKQVARELAISEKTVEYHVGTIFRKLGLSSRAQLAAFVVTRDARVEL